MSSDYQKVRALVDGLHDDAKLWVFRQPWAVEAAGHLHEGDPDALWTLLSGEMLALADRVRSAELEVVRAELEESLEQLKDGQTAPATTLEEERGNTAKDALLLTVAENRLNALVRKARTDMRHNDYWGGDDTDMEAYRAGVRGGLGGAAGELAAVFTPEAAYHLRTVLEHARRALTTRGEDERRYSLQFAVAYLVEMAEDMFPQDEKGPGE